MREKIHSFWESFARSAFFFAIFLSVWLVAVGADKVEHAASAIVCFTRSPHGKTLIGVLERLDLLKVLWIGVAFLIGLGLYLFDRVGFMMGPIMPPTLVWNGSPVPFVNRSLVTDLWTLLPKVTNAASLDFEARMIVTKAEWSGHKFDDEGSKAYVRKQMDGSIRLFIFAKVGIAWTLVCLVWALRLRRHFILEALLFALGFLFLGLVGIVRATHFLLRQNEEEMRNAKMILHSEGILPASTPERWAEFEKTSENAVRHAPRFVTLKWTPADGGWARLYRAFTGFSKKVPAPRVRD